ncbi:hypothetical protein [Streptomyces sp. NPDC050564]
MSAVDLPMAPVARRVGYENPGVLRTLLRERDGVTARSLRG